MNQLEMFKYTVAVGIQTFLELFKWPWRWKEIFKNTKEIGIGSLPIIVLSTTFAGLVITHEIAWHMQIALHTVSMVPGFTGQFIIRELGVAIPALLLVSKVGASITAEVGSMKVTEQVDALKLLRINPISYLVFPKWIASIIALGCLTLISVFVTMSFAMGVAILRYNFSLLEYLNMLQAFVGPREMIHALIKGMCFGAVIPIVSCAYGLKCQSGAQGVGMATTESVVTSTVMVIVLDFTLTFIFVMLA